MRTRISQSIAVMCLVAAVACGSGTDEATTDSPSTDPPASTTTIAPPTTKISLLFVGHGEPADVAEGDVPISFPDGSEFGPHAATLGAPVEMQHTEWAAAYDEIATAMTYTFPDVNDNGVEHEMKISPAGDVPPFFTWDAFHDEVAEIYASFGDHSPHNELLTEHVAAVAVHADGAEIVTQLAFLDAVPRIPDVIWEIDQEGGYDAIVVVPMLLASSTHTQEIEEQIEAAAALTGGIDVVVTAPFFEDPEMRTHVKTAVVSMAEELRTAIPADVADDEIGVVLAAHGTPYLPADPSYGWEEGEIYSDLAPAEEQFHDEIGVALPWATRTGRMNYAEPTIEETLTAFENDGIDHVIVVPSAFPTAAMHTMYDVAEPSVGRPATPDEGVVVYERPSGMTVYYTANGYADLDAGRDEFRAGLTNLAQVAVTEVLATAG